MTKILYFFKLAVIYLQKVLKFEKGGGKSVERRYRLHEMELYARLTTNPLLKSFGPKSFSGVKV